MKNGDLSNITGYTFAFRCENFLIHYRNDSLIDKAYNALFDKAKHATVNEEVSSVMEYIYRETEYTVDLVVSKDNYTEALKGIIDNLPFNRVLFIEKPSQLTSRLIVGEITYYVDDDEEYLGLVNSEYAVTLEKFRQILRRKTNGRR